ncbi:MAG: sigma-70 family RNA polymerase sigma factor [Candidatus Dojkabacteria bacterium]
MSNKVTKNDIALIYDSQFDRIYKFFYYKTLNKNVAEDLTSETFLTFVNLLNEHKDIENLNAFIYGIAKNMFMQFLRKKYQEGIPFSAIDKDFEEYAVEFVQEYDNSESSEDKLLKILHKIPSKQQDVIRLRFIEKLSLDEICIRLEKDMNYVKTTQKRGLKSLKAALELNANIDEEL